MKLLVTDPEKLDAICQSESDIILRKAFKRLRRIDDLCLKVKSICYC